MSSTAASRPFPLPYMVRTIFGLFACWIVLYNARHDVSHHQWWLTLIYAGIALATGIFDIYDRDMPDGIFGPMNMTNISWLILTLGVPACLLIGGMAGSHALPSAIGAIVLTFNAFVLASFREWGLPGLVATVAIVAMALF